MAQEKAAEQALLDLSYELTTDSSAADTDRILRRLAGERLSPVAERRVLNEIKRRTKMSIATLVAELSTYRQNLPERRAPGWRAQLLADDDGHPLPLAVNVLTALRHDRSWHGVLQLNEFTQQPWICSRPPWIESGQKWDRARAFTDADEARVLIWMQENDIRVGERAVKSALTVAFDDLKFHPVRDYLDAVRWDKKSRLAEAPAYYFGCEPIVNYSEIVFAKWMISAVARIFEPGCMAKYVLILEGPQDLRKSMALEALGGQWFTDDLETLGSKDSKLQIGNAWIIELAEFASAEKADAGTAKSFISRKVDRFRRPYGHNVVEQERQCVLAATVNPPPDGYFKDLTGNVRYWPLVCTAIDIDALRRDRDQLWAEAVHRYRAGEQWYVEEEEARTVILVEQEKRQPIEAWHGVIEGWLEMLAQRYLKKITTEDVMRGALELTPGNIGWNRGSQTKIGIVLRALGWKQDPGNQERPRPYFRPDRG